MPRKIIPWPDRWMRAWYERDGLTMQEIADRLAEPEWRFYWIWAVGSPYRPTAKLVQKVAKRNKWATRPTGAKGSRNGSWRGGRTIDKSGYLLVRRPEHPAANSAGYVRHHRLVMEEAIGRPLGDREVVHHKNGDKLDNRPENLMVFEENSHHLQHELTGRVPKWTSRGIEGMRRPRARIHLELAVSMRQRGASLERIALAVGASPETVRRHLQSLAGFPMRPAG